MILKENERIDHIFQNKLPIIQSREVFSFSFDAVILAHYAKITKKTKNILDLCSGNGAIATFLAKKTDQRITEIEIQARLADMAWRTAILNNIESQIDILNIDLKDSLNFIQHDSMDLICCNPPYFKNISTSIKNPNQYLAIARHELKTNLFEVIKIISQLLKFGGKVFFIYRPERIMELMILFHKFNLGIQRIKFIHSFIDTSAKMVLVEGTKGSSFDGIEVTKPLIIFQEKNIYTDEFRDLING